MTSQMIEITRSNTNSVVETPMTIVDTVWEPHSVPIAYLKPFALASKPPHPDTHFQNLVHSVQTHLPWQQHSHGAPPAVCPETDIRETAQAYHIEIALAGVSDKSSVSIEWNAPRTLVIRGGITSREGGAHFARPPPKEKFGGMLKKFASDGDGEKADATSVVAPDGCVELEGHSNGGDHHNQPLFILKERRLGVFQRTFTLPVDIDGEGCRARLKYGLLRIDIPKKVPQQKQDEAEILIGLHDDETNTP